MLEPFRRLLFLEADPTWKSLVLEHLRESGFGEKEGYAIVHLSDIENGFAAIERDGDFVAVITTLENPGPTGQFPKFNGLELLRRLRAHSDEKFRKLPVIVHAIESGCDHEVTNAGHAKVVPKLIFHKLAGELRELLASAQS